MVAAVTILAVIASQVQDLEPKSQYQKKHLKWVTRPMIQIQSKLKQEWTNDDSQAHTVTSGTDSSDPNMGKEFDSSPGLNTLLSTDQTFSHKFTTAGEFPYFCQLHPTMVGKVVVVS
jgi:Copper binding proteins, plastocyanin/azurin family